MKRKTNIIAIIITIIILIGGCSPQVNPETTVREFIEAVKDLNLDEIALKINPKDKGIKEQLSNIGENEEEEFQKYFLEYMRLNAKKITYEIETIEIKDESAIASVKFKYINGGPLLKETISEYIPEAFSQIFTGKEMTDEENTEMFIGIMEEKKGTIEESFIEKTVEIQCIKIDDQWYIDNPSYELLDVAMSNILSIGKELEEFFNLGLFDLDH